MPVLTKNVPTKKLILPKSSKGKDKAWVEIVAEARIGLIYDIEEDENKWEASMKMLSRIIMKWNFVDEEGKDLAITPESIKLLPLADIIFIQRETGLTEELEGINKQKKSS